MQCKKICRITVRKGPLWKPVQLNPLAQTLSGASRAILSSSPHAALSRVPASLSHIGRLTFS
eukprot:5605141-Pyramimonas_sp.AAC.1